MKFWRAWRGENRQGDDDDDDPVVRALLAEQGRTAATATAALETAAGWWSRALTTANVSPASVARGLTPPVLARIGRELCIRGEVVFVLDATIEAGLVFRPCSAVDVTGGPDEASWRYRVDMPGPSRTTSASRPSTDVLHVRYATARATPWRGQSPLAASPATANLAKTIEAQLGDEFKIPTFHAIFAGGAGEGDENDAAALKAHYRDARGGIVIGAVPRDSAGFGGVQQSPASERIGPKPTAQIHDLRESVADSVFESCGISPGLAKADSAGAAREAYRQFAVATMEPIAALLETELRRKVDRSARIDLKRLMAADVSGRARAWRQLREGGMSEAQAALVTGLEA